MDIKELKELSEKNERFRQELIEIIENEIDAINEECINIHGSIIKDMFDDRYDDKTILRFENDELDLCYWDGKYNEVIIDDGRYYSTPQLIIIYESVQEMKDLIKNRFEEENAELENVINNHRKGE